jgi:hypothetical protein
MLSYYLVEQPIRRGAFRGWRGRVAVPTGFATAGLVVVVATAGATAASPLQQVQIGQRPPYEPAPTVTAGHRAGAPMPRVLLVGDSVPYTLLPGVQPLAASRGVTLDAVLVAGCSVVGGVAVYSNGKIPPGASGCEKRVNDDETAALNREQPDLVVWVSVWETNDRIVNGKRIIFGNSTWDTMMLDQIDTAARRLTAGGAHLVIATMAPRAPNDLVPPSDISEVSRFVRLDELYVRYARSHPDSVSIVDFGIAVCPDGPPCPRTVDGIEPRPVDGVHFTLQTASWAAGHLLDGVLACQRAEAGWRCPEPPAVVAGSQPGHK